MGDHLRLRLIVSLVVAGLAALAATVLGPLGAAAVLIVAAALAGALLAPAGALLALPLLLLADGVTAKVAVVLAGVLPVAALQGRRLLTARRGRHRASPAPAPAKELPDLVAEVTEEWSAATGIGVILHSAGLDEGTEAGAELGWILREALANVHAHARAETVAVTLARDGDRLTLEVRDDGDGFAVPEPPAELPGSGGLAGMRERARHAGGLLEVWSRPGGGTRITATVPADVATAAAAPSARVRLVAAAGALVVPLLLVLLVNAPDERATWLAERASGPTLDPRATHGPATAAAQPGTPARSSGGPASPAASRAASARASAPAGAPAVPVGSPGTTVADARPCKVTYTKRSEWNNGYVADVTLTNTGANQLRNWSLTFSYGAGQQITNSWNAVVVQNHAAVSVGPTSDRPVLAPGETLTFGVQGTWTNTNPNPTTFTLNGAQCG